MPQKILHTGMELRAASLLLQFLWKMAPRLFHNAWWGGLAIAAADVDCWAAFSVFYSQVMPCY